MSYLSRHEFLLRRLHSLSGLIPVGAFLCVHLLVNASLLGSPEAFQANVDRIHSLGPILPLVEWVLIFLPILFHGILGLAIVAGAVPNTTSYPLAGNLRYVLQRVTGLIAFAYILAHVAHMHWMGQPLQRFQANWFAQFDPHHAAATAAAAIQGSLLVPLLYGLGTLACVYHLANGVWTMGITWGLWTSPAGQWRATCLCAAVGVGLAVVGTGALVGLMRFDTAHRTRADGPSPAVAGTTPTALTARPASVGVGRRRQVALTAAGGGAGAAE